MNDAKDGGPAFPFYHGEGPDQAVEGMSLRDYFAAMALQAMLNVPVEHESEIAEAAYKVADAMLKERAK